MSSLNLDLPLHTWLSSNALWLGRNERQIGHVKAMPHANGQTREPPPDVRAICYT